MKIVEYSKGSITEVENVFKVVESGAQGPQGEPGTIGTLDLLDPKTTPVDADLMLVGDSAASFANKKTTWANIKATLIAAFDLLYQPLSSALSKITEAGGLPLWDGAAWPGGGGGGEWTDISTQVVSSAVSSVDFENVFTDDYDTYELLVDGSQADANSQFFLTLGSGVTPVYTTAFHKVNTGLLSTAASSYLSVVSNVASAFTPARLTFVPNNIYYYSGKLYNVRNAAITPTFRGFGHTFDITVPNSGYKLDFFGLLDDTTTVFDHLRIRNNTGNIISGTYTIRGKNV